eukprot:CAMPEP_0184691376 /NCGR_PEP_ID=MMETSP0313-20130426/253_1 /TAXON_ID=2792 /ORGANISM="Porphyridium aerugineum, Strain SAG 1380-2" /LENGTH=882 /DNA_ID=CAMNT_0027149077 /DNA_START=159 /DNA_END=2807 /DNA_ORIENTATION=-
MEVEAAGATADPVEETLVQPLTLAEMRAKQGGREPKGTIGREFVVTSNLLTINIDPKLTTLYQYSVDLERLPPPGRGPLSEKARRVRTNMGYRVIEKVGNEWFDPPTVLAYDGKNTVYSVRNLLEPGESKEQDIALDERLIIRVKFSAPSALPVSAIYEYIRDELDTSRQDVLNAIQTVLNFNPRTRLTPVKKNGFYMQEGEVAMGGPVTLWPGFKQGIKVGQGGLYLNISHSRTEMWKDATLDEIIRVCFHPDALRIGLNDRDIFRFDNLFKKLDVKPLHREARKPMRIVGVSRVPATEIRFKLEDGVATNVAEYFANRYNRPLRFPNFQCVDTGVPNKREIWTPMEVVRIIAGQHYKKPLTRKEQGERLKIENVRPHITFNKLKQMYEHVNDDDRILKVFGLDVNRTFVQVKARLLTPPLLMYGLRQTPDGLRRLVLRPENGSWNMSGNTLYESNVDLTNWGVINFDHRFELSHVQRFVQDLVKLARENGMRITNVSPRIYLGDPSNPRQVFEEAVAQCGGNKCQLMLVLKTVDDQLYQNVKVESDTRYGFPSQVVLTSKVGRGDSQSYRSNVALKMNMKLGSRNYILETSYTEKLSEQKVMAIGIAISRGRQIGKGLEQRHFAAAVGSMDSKMMHYQSRSCELAPGKDKGIPRLDKMIKELLKDFRETSNSYPETLLVFREGLTEGRWAVKNAERNVFHREMTAIWKACNDLENGYKPKVVYIVVNKGNRARFITDDNNFTDRSGNVKPGTVVDTQIVSPRYPEFYLISHVGLQGTARPCKYTILWDELEMSMDELQEMCHNFCYTFARCTKAVSMVAPVYYASLMALREMLLSGQSITGEEGTKKDPAPTPEGVGQPSSSSEPLDMGANSNLKTMFYV